ncbi:hypothetical protein N7516_011086 [Penicillium verrucosum]|uniref:uncharacterized protein n=1 Tax=Penicillium verrucosum TaxID=60171 RepID=UPI002545B851|nr:uncharacterized protein N7516_011086 [Penicillium verrucosum]KAJ5920228.1 hypothetical protein N7516_011086 [Penicillium verrucosum]
MEFISEQSQSLQLRRNVDTLGVQLDVLLTPPRVLRFRDVLETFRTEDFDIQYGSVNRFRFMGNGMTLSQERVYY